MKIACKEFANNCIIFFLIYLLLYGSVVFSGFLNNDDVARTFNGYYSWYYDGRIVSDWLIKVVIGNHGVVNVGPLFKLLALACMAASSAVILLVYNIPFGVKGFFCGSLIFCFPTMLENLSYTYDSFPMMFSVLCVILAIYNLLIKNKISWLACIMLIFISLNTYQASMNVFLVFWFVMLVVDIANNNEIMPNLIKGGVVLILAFFLYKITILFFYEFNAYSSSKSELVSIFNLSLIKKNILFFYRELGGFIEYNTCFLMSVLGIFLLLFFNVLVRKIGWLEKFKIYLYLGCSIFSVMGTLVLLKFPVVAPRTMIAAGACISGAMIVATKISSKNILYAYQFLGFIIVVSFCSLSYTYGTYTHNVQDDILTIYPKIAQAMNHNTNEGEKIFVIGEPYLPQSQIANNKYKKVINKITRQPVMWGSIWGYIAMKQYGFNDKAKYSINHGYAETVPLLKNLMPIIVYDDIRLKLYKFNQNVYFVFY